ncbi:MAG TPA: hypothetical protein PLV92_23140, partial [Pirellulaceae bacterium]|nr:hypothetical protein [Pirellulaceae bacterium]
MAVVTERSTRAADYRAAGPRVDLNQDTPRGDVVSPAWENWKVAAGAKSSFRVARVGRLGQDGQVGRTEQIERAGLVEPAGQGAGAGGGAKDGGEASAAELEFELAALDADKPLDTAWWRPGFDYPARMASDGVVCRGPIRLTVRGLSAGRHSIGTWHNGLTDATPSPIRIVCKVGAMVVSEATVRPTKQVVRDDASAGGHVEFELKDGQSVEVEFLPRDGGGVVLNGLEVDRPDPRRRALQPSPADDDEHAVESPVLRWAAASGATAHHVYLGTNRDAVARATQGSPEFRGVTTVAEFKTESLGLTHREPVYWRIDEVFGDGDGATKGNGGAGDGGD